MRRLIGSSILPIHPGVSHKPKKTAIKPPSRARKFYCIAVGPKQARSMVVRDHLWSKNRNRCAHIRAHSLEG